MSNARKWPVGVIALLAVVLGVAPLYASKLYRWVDDEGNVHFTDRMPAEQVDKGRTELNEQGLTIDQVAPAKTPEERARDAELERLRREQQRLREKQEAEDRVLLRTFHSVDDIALARDGKLAAVDVLIRVSERNNKLLKAKLAEEEKRAANLERAGKPIPEKWQNEIASTRRSLNEGYANILRHQQNKAIIRETYDEDIRRFRTLKNMQQEETEVGHDRESGAADLANVYRCEDAVSCDQAWSQAQAFAEGFATTELQQATDDLIITKPPLQDNDISLTIARLREAEGDAATLFLDVQCRDSTDGREFCEGREVELIIGRFRPYMRFQIHQP
jgi:hypothetical protein